MGGGGKEYGRGNYFQFYFLLERLALILLAKYKTLISEAISEVGIECSLKMFTCCLAPCDVSTDGRLILQIISFLRALNSVDLSTSPLALDAE